MRVLLPLKKGLTSNNKSDSSLSQQQQQQQGDGSGQLPGTKTHEACELEESQDDVDDDNAFSADDSLEEQENEPTPSSENTEPWTPQEPEIDNLQFEEVPSGAVRPSVVHESISPEEFVDESIVSAIFTELPAERQKRKSTDNESTTAQYLKKLRSTQSYVDSGKKPASITSRSSPPPRMAGGRQKSDDDRRVPPTFAVAQSATIDVVNENDIYENDPASALGDPQAGLILVQGDTEIDDEFHRALKKRGLEIREQEGDGNCLFRAVSLQVYGDPSMHNEVRQQCLDFMSKDEEHFSQFVTDEPFVAYIQRKRQDGVHGNNPEIQAISELFNRPVEVFVPENGATPLNIFHEEYKTADAPIRLSYHDGNHYNAVVDPLVPTAGLGLGLPGLQLGLADKLQVAKAVAESDKLADQMDMERALEDSQNDQLQRAIKESTLSMDYMYKNKAIALSDVDATNFELEQAVLESSLETFKSFEQGRKPSSTASGKRRRPGRASPPSQGFDHIGEGTNHSQVASLPGTEVNIPAAASAPFAVASVAARAPENSSPSLLVGSVDEYPQTVQELVMNGFDLRKVVHAYELIGDNFDDLLAFLMQSASH